jgi:hypothetical protein
MYAGEGQVGNRSWKYFVELFEANVMRLYNKKQRKKTHTLNPVNGLPCSRNNLD